MIQGIHQSDLQLGKSGKGLIERDVPQGVTVHIFLVGIQNQISVLIAEAIAGFQGSADVDIRAGVWDIGGKLQGSGMPRSPEQSSVV